MYLIAGIDPGTTAGVAVLGFDGEVVCFFSSKDLSMDKIISRLIDLGRVSVIATDVQNPPSFVSKLAAQLGAVVYSPESSLSVKYKVDSTREYKPGDAHQRDALAAALYAFQKFKNSFQRIESQGLGDEVKHLFLRGYSIDEAAKTLSGGEPEAPLEEKAPPEPRSQSPAEKKIRRLEKKNRSLKDALSRKEEELGKLAAELSASRAQKALGFSRDQELRKRDRFISSLKKSVSRLRGEVSEVQRLKKIWVLAGKGVIQPVGVFPEIFDGFSFIKRKLKKKDLSLLGDLEVAFTSTESDYSTLADAGVLACGPESLKEVAGCYYIKKSDIGKLKPKTVSLDLLVEEYRKGRD